MVGQIAGFIEVSDGCALAGNTGVDTIFVLDAIVAVLMKSAGSVSTDAHAIVIVSRIARITGALDWLAPISDARIGANPVA